MTLAAPDPGLVRADAGQIEQVLVNLAVNARDAMPEGGKLTIETSNVWLEQAYARAPWGLRQAPMCRWRSATLAWAWTKRSKRYAFEPFFTTKEPGRGTGLGLATCYGIVKQHGGTIELYSEPGVAPRSKSTCRASRAVPIGLPQPDAAERTCPRGTETVLLVEDEAGVRALVARVLGNLGYTVLEASEGDEALRFAKAYTGPAIDLLLTDVVCRGWAGARWRRTW